MRLITELVGQAIDAHIAWGSEVQLLKIDCTRRSGGGCCRESGACLSDVFRGKVRMIRSEPTFTPYFALSGDDATRLSYLAEIALGTDAKDMPQGFPLSAVFPGLPTHD